MGKKSLLIMIAIVMVTLYSGNAQTIVNSLTELRSAVQKDNQNIVMTPGSYNLADMPNGSRVIACSGSGNTINLTGVHVIAPVGVIRATYITMSGNNNTWIGGEFEDVYSNGMTEVTDFIAYNNDKTNFASGLNGGDRNVVLNIWGADNLFKDLKLTTRGSFPYGYGSMYGINGTNTFGLDKRGGILITSANVTLDGIEIQHRSFSHGIIMQEGSENTVIKNCLVEGRVRLGSELYLEGEGSLPYRSDYLMPHSGNIPIPKDDYFSLSEDGIRSYKGSGTVIVENCTVKKMRGGIRLYLGGSATVTNSTSIDCGSVNWNMPSGGTITNSSGNFAYAPLSDFRLSRSNMDIEWTIIPSPHATGPHNIADVLGNNHNIVFHRTPGPLDNCTRPIVVSGDNSTIINETEYTIILESTASGNKITSCGPVIDNGTGNTITKMDCEIFGAIETIEAENYLAMLGVDTIATTDEGLGAKVSAIDTDDWMEYEITVPTSGSYLLGYRVSGISKGDFKVEMNGEIVDAINFDATGSEETWETVRSGSPFDLNEGVDTIKIISNVSGWNLNWIELIPQCYATSIIPRISTIDMRGVESELMDTAEVVLFPGLSVNLNPKENIGGSWSWTGPNGFNSTERAVLIDEIQTKQGGEYEAIYMNQCGFQSKQIFTVLVQDSVYIEAEDYSNMNGIETETTTDVSGDKNVTSITSGDWMEYEINVPFSATYFIDYRISSDGSGELLTSVNNLELNKLSFNAEAAWTIHSASSAVYLKAGVQTFRITSKSDGWKLNWIKLRGEQPVSSCSLPLKLEGFRIQDSLVEWSSGLMDISCETEVDLHLVVEGRGSLETSDYLNVYYKLDGGEKVVLTEVQNNIDLQMVSAKILSGSTLEIIIESKVVSTPAYYDVEDIIVIKSSEQFLRIEAEDFTDKDGCSTESTSDTGGGENVGSIKDGNWLMFSDVNLANAQSISLRLATKYANGTVEVRLGSTTGTRIATLDVPNTGGWQKWETVRSSITNKVGIYDIYLVFKTSSSYVGNINWLEFSSEDITSVKRFSNNKIILYPNPVRDELTIEANIGSKIEIYNTIGHKVFEDVMQSNKQTISTQALDNGIYNVIVYHKGAIETRKFIALN